MHNGYDVLVLVSAILGDIDILIAGGKIF